MFFHKKNVNFNLGHCIPNIYLIDKFYRRNKKSICDYYEIINSIKAWPNPVKAKGLDLITPWPKWHLIIFKEWFFLTYIYVMLSNCTNINKQYSPATQFTSLEFLGLNSTKSIRSVVTGKKTKKMQICFKLQLIYHIYGFPVFKPI